MIKCLIVEDEIAGQVILKQKLKEFFPQCIIENTIDNKEEALDFLSKNEIHLAFLDVEIKGGTGIEILQSIDTNKIETIFITAYKKYAIEALNNKASFYLLKPISNAPFKKGMNEVIEKIVNKRLSSTILVPHNKIHIPIAIKDIIYIKSEGAYSIIHIQNDHFMTSKSLSYYEDFLPKSVFIRTHNSFLVNDKHIVAVEKGRNGLLTMKNGDKVPVSQRRINDFLEHLKSV